MRDLVLVLLVALGCSAAVAVGGASVLRGLRTRSLATSVTVVAVVAVAAVLVGAVGTALSMFTSGHDLTVLLVLSVPAAAVGVVVALLFGRRLAADVEAVAAVAADTGTTGRQLPAELGRLAEELRATRGRVEEGHRRELALEASRRELVAWVSHDLRTPLAGLRAMAEALEDGVVSDATTVQRYHRRMRLEVDRLAGMVGDLFELSLLQSDTLRLTLARVSLADLVGDALATADPLARAKQVSLRGRAETTAPVRVDAGEVARVLSNLLVNAIRHTPSEGVVEVVGGSDAEWAYVEIADSCGGIPLEDLPRVFDVAFRGQVARTPSTESDVPAGAGLGLAIARGIVEAHQGEISVDNHGDGCRFVVRLPLAGEPEPASAASRPADVTALADGPATMSPTG